MPHATTKTQCSQINKINSLLKITFIKERLGQQLVIYYVGYQQTSRRKTVLHSVNRNAIPSHSIHQCHKERLTRDALKQERRCHADKLGRMTQTHQEQNTAARGTYKQPEDERRGIIKWMKTFIVFFFYLSQISKCNKIYQLNTGNALWSQLHHQTFT